MRFIIIAVLCTLVLGCKAGINPRATVSITNSSRNSGGSGTVITSTPSGSAILTNSHVCELTKKGGYVRSILGEFPVVAIQQSQTHDLCLVIVNADMGVNTRVASHSPTELSTATVSGHPRLLPTIISTGNFSERITIPVVIGMRECTEDDVEIPELAFLCAFFGKLPIIRNYDSQVIGALIQPGSSGSGVYNEDGELTAVVFAGSGDLSYGYVVPYEYIANFLKYESASRPFQPVDNVFQLAPRRSDNSSSALNAIIQKCTNPKTRKEAKACRAILRANDSTDLIYREAE